MAEKSISLSNLTSYNDNIKANYQTIVDTNLKTTDKTVTGAINENTDKIDILNTTVTNHIINHPNNSSVIDVNYYSKKVNIPNTSKAKKGCVVFISDDGHSAEIKFKAVFDKYNKKYCIAVIPSWVGTTKDLTVGGGLYLTWDEIKQFQSAGHEILSHTNTHVGLDANNSADIKDITDAIASFRQNGINVESLVYPYNRASDIVQQNVLKYHRAGIGGTILEPKNMIPLNHKHYMMRVEARGSDGADYSNYTSTRILEANQNGEMLIFMMHAHYEPQAKQAELAEAMIKFCIANNVDICTLSEALDRFENIIQVGGGYGDTNSYWCLAPDKNIYSKSVVDITSVTLDKSIANVNVGGSVTLTPTILPANTTNTNLNWSSSNTSIATVNNGVVTGVASGSCEIACISASNSTIKATCTINVSVDAGGTPTSIVLDNCVGWLDARDPIVADTGKWCMVDKINNTYHISMNSGTDPTYHQNGAIIVPNSIDTDKYNGKISFGNNSFTLSINLKLAGVTAPATDIAKWYDNSTAGTFVRIDQGKVCFYKAWTKLLEITIPSWAANKNINLTIRVNGTSATVFHNSEVFTGTLSAQFVNFTTFKFGYSGVGSNYFHSMYMYSTALTDDDVNSNLSYEASITRG